MGPLPLKIRIYGDPCLRKKSSAVKSIGPAERMLIHSMVVTMYQAKGIGLAAPQVGVNQRFFVADVGQGAMAFVNPAIIKRSGSSALEEGCLSIPEVTVLIKRPQKVTVRYMDENNQSMELTCDDLLARVIQHEIDHLDGKLIVDYAGRSEKAKMKDQLKKLTEQSKETR